MITRLLQNLSDHFEYESHYCAPLALGAYIVYKHGIFETIPFIRAIAIQNLLSDFTHEADAHIPVERVFLTIGYAALPKRGCQDTEDKAVFITLHAVAVITALVAYHKEPSRYREIYVSMIAGVCLGYLAARYSDVL